MKGPRSHPSHRSSLPSSLASVPQVPVHVARPLLPPDSSTPTTITVPYTVCQPLKPRTAMSLSRMSWDNSTHTENLAFAYAQKRVGNRSGKYRFMNENLLKNRRKPSFSPSKPVKSLDLSPISNQSPGRKIPKIRLIAIISPPVHKESSRYLEPWTTERRRSKATAYF